MILICVQNTTLGKQGTEHLIPFFKFFSPLNFLGDPCSFPWCDFNILLGTNTLYGLLHHCRAPRPPELVLSILFCDDTLDSLVYFVLSDILWLGGALDSPAPTFPTQQLHSLYPPQPRLPLPHPHLAFLCTSQFLRRERHLSSKSILLEYRPGWFLGYEEILAAIFCFPDLEITEMHGAQTGNWIKACTLDSLQIQLRGFQQARSPMSEESCK